MTLQRSSSQASGTTTAGRSVPLRVQDDGTSRVESEEDFDLALIYDVLERIQSQLSHITGVNLDRGERLDDA